MPTIDVLLQKLGSPSGSVYELFTCTLDNPVNEFAKIQAQFPPDLCVEFYYTHEQRITFVRNEVDFQLALSRTNTEGKPALKLHPFLYPSYKTPKPSSCQTM